MRAHWSDGHLYSGDRVRKLQANHYFLIDTGAGKRSFYIYMMLSVIAWSTSWILMR